jgi:hypothetical protein
MLFIAMVMREPAIIVKTADITTGLPDFFGKIYPKGKMYQNGKIY